MIAGNLYRLLALKLDRYHNATPHKIWRHFLDATGTLHITGNDIACALNLRSHHPVLIDAGFADLETTIPDGTTAPCGSASHHDDHQVPGNLNSIT